MPSRWVFAGMDEGGSEYIPRWGSWIVGMALGTPVEARKLGWSTPGLDRVAFELPIGLAYTL